MWSYQFLRVKTPQRGHKMETKQVFAVLPSWLHFQPGRVRSVRALDISDAPDAAFGSKHGPEHCVRWVTCFLVLVEGKLCSESVPRQTIYDLV